MKDNNPSLRSDTVIVEQKKYKGDEKIKFYSYDKKQLDEYFDACCSYGGFITVALFYVKGKRPLLEYEANKIKNKL